MRHHRLCFLLFLLLISPTLISCINKEGLYLQRAKLTFDDPNAVFSNWNPRDRTPCNWNGVVCDSDAGSVISLDLSSSSLSGPFPFILCRLENLSFVSFYDNFINSTLSEDYIATCRSLVHLDLAQNYLTGVLPRTLADLPNLKYLDLTGNNFSGFIPQSFGTFRKLEVLSLMENLLEGAIPSFLGNLSTLKQLNLSYNPFSPGRIPPELGNLTNLEVLWLTGTNLVGEIPSSLGRLRRLTDLDVAYNSLTGPIPNSLTELTAAVQLELYNNSLTGEMPRTGWSNMTSLLRFDASMNELTGQIPAELCGLPLESLNLYENNLRGELPAVIADSPNLYELKLFQNQLSGKLPVSLGKSSPLRWIDVSYNNFSGQLPENLCFNGALEELLMIENSFSGGVPARLGECRSLQRVRLGHNKISGEVPAGLWGLPHVSLIELIGNSFSGGIAKTIAGASNLSQLILSENSFTDALPEEIGFLSNLLEFSGNDNNFSGSLPGSIVNLGQLVKLDLHDNAFSGEIPNGIHSWKKLNELNLANNEFSGEIPSEIGDLPVLNYLDLSGNQFSHKIPIELQNLKLNRLNLSCNYLTGDIPTTYAKRMYKDSFLGNPGLCGDIEGLCDDGREIQNMVYLWFLRSIFVFAILVLIFSVIWLYLKYMKSKKVKMSVDNSKWTLMSFHKLGFNENEILNALDEDNVIGTGASGKVYKAVLSQGEVVAVKKLWGSSKLADDDGFDAEVETLGKIRHKNIVKLWCCCVTRDCKLLVYEYMANGSLGDMLRGTKSGLLDWPTRFKIAVDAAEGLSYLHHDCVPPIVHRDVKSNNILLDADFGARVADFGVAKVVDVDGKGNKSMSIIAGSCGYIAPEYAYTLRVNEKSDIYSLGVVILELVTGKPPIDPEFGEKHLVKWVCATLDQKGIDHVIDPKLDSCFKDEICVVMNIGLLCTSPVPVNRPPMRRVVKMLQEIGARSETKSVGKDGKLTPNYYEDNATDQV
ncbi:receptor-like protein kinase hsl1 [Phtheirospermum japonicum]|uniref:non-specific serine/threonine protein kinase n=1 Tax=Phtheirospermum japonicum TaxID=374723 RepID=A0A830AY90_9LAMI|nr:receptor-like protein kinase hsl1 [Phtheirospermum japonicum]